MSTVAAGLGTVLTGGPVQNAIGGVVLGAGVLLVAAGAVGLVRLPDVYNRTNAVTKAAGLGIVAILVGVAILVPEPGCCSPSAWPWHCSCSRSRSPASRSGTPPTGPGPRRPRRRCARTTPAPPTPRGDEG